MTLTCNKIREVIVFHVVFLLSLPNKEKLRETTDITPDSARKYTLCFQINTQNVGRAEPQTYGRQVVGPIANQNFKKVSMEKQSVYFLLGLRIQHYNMLHK